MKRPYIALGINQQGRTTPTLLARAAARGRGLVQQYLIADDPADTNPWDVPPPSDMPLRQGWEAERIDPGHAWARYVAIVLLAVLCSWVLSGCTALPRTPAATAATPAQPACPPLLLFGPDQPLTGWMAIYKHCRRDSLVIYDPQTETAPRVHGIGVGSRTIPTPAKAKPREGAAP